MDDKDLKKYIIENIKGVYKSALESVELRFGRDFEGFQAMRSKILRSGNDAIRRIEAILDEKSGKDEG